MSLSPAQIARNRIGGIVRQNPEADVNELRRDLVFETLAETIKRKVDEAPPLTQGQLAKLCALLRGR